MILRILYRSVGSENSKNRPDFYSKVLALASLLRAVEKVEIPTRIVFVNDGPMPADRLSMMTAAGEVLPVSCGSNRASYRHVLRLPRARRWPADDLVWLAEDDYLYTETALSSLVTAAAALPRETYFTLYSTLRFTAASTRRRPSTVDGGGTTPADPVIDGVAWARAATTTSTFGLRVDTLAADERLLRSIPFVGGAFDRATCLTLQGFQPFRLADLGGEPPAVEPPSAAVRLARRAALTGVRATLNAVALARPEQRHRTLVVPDPCLAVHMERGDALVPGQDWAAHAAAVQGWLTERHPEHATPAPGSPAAGGTGSAAAGDTAGGIAGDPAATGWDIPGGRAPAETSAGVPATPAGSDGVRTDGSVPATSPAGRGSSVA